MTEPRPPRAPPGLLTLAHLSAFLLGSLIWMITMAVLYQVYLAIGTGDTAYSSGSATQISEMGPAFLGVATFIQGLGLAALAGLLGLLLPAPGEGWATIPLDKAALRTRLIEVFALRAAPPPWIVAGSLGALTVGWLPSWIAEQLLQRMPEGYVSTMEILPSLLRSEDPGRFVLIAGVILGAPLFEELVFRGYLWRALRHAGPPVFAWLGTSILFALFHQDPVHITALMPVALFIGWLRWVSGSIWPAIAAHFVNNAIGVVSLWIFPDPQTTPLPLSVALLGLAFTLAVCAATWLWQRPHQEFRR